MRTLIVQVLPEYEGIDSTQEISIPDYFSWDLRFFCNDCGEESIQDELFSHVCKGDEE